MISSFLFISSIYVFAWLRINRPSFVFFKDWFLKDEIPESFQQHAFLDKHIIFYQHLSVKGKLKFLRRMNAVLQKEHIDVDADVEKKTDARWYVAASQVILTFGQKEYLLPFIEEILVIPDTFTMQNHEHTYTGVTTSEGKMVYSFKKLKEGFEPTSLTYNIGLHEMMHAVRLSLEHLPERKNERIFSDFIVEFEESAIEHLLSLRNQYKHSEIRSYALTNLDEFISCSVEFFMELPEVLYKELPAHYGRLCILLNINPLNTSNDYQLTNSFINEHNRNFPAYKLPNLHAEHEWNRLFTNVTLMIGYVCSLYMLRDMSFSTFIKIQLLGTIFSMFIMPLLVVINHHMNFKFMVKWYRMMVFYLLGLNPIIAFIQWLVFK